MSVGDPTDDTPSPAPPSAPPGGRPLCELSVQVLVAWALACIGLPFAILMGRPQTEQAPEAETAQAPSPPEQTKPSSRPTSIEKGRTRGRPPRASAP